MLSATPSKLIKKRKVFYIPGYDPMLPRRYRELYRVEGIKQAKISGYELRLKGKIGEHKNYGWTVDTCIDGKKTHTDVDFLLWSDIVSDSLDVSVFHSYIMLVNTAWNYISTGALRRILKLQKGPAIAALYPVFAMILQLVVGVILALFFYRLGAYYVHWSLGLVSGAIAFLWLLHWIKKNDNKFYIYYLLHDFALSSSRKGAYPLALEQRMLLFSYEIHAALQSDFDEVLVVGHSVGAHLSISILSDMLRDLEPLKQKTKLSLLTIGNVVPMVSFLPDAWRLRRDLRELSCSDQLTWIDISAPGDGACFALCDPVKVSGVATNEQKWPLVISAAFSQSLKPETFKKLKNKFFRMHFQYLCAFDNPKDYDYFKITAGSVSLKDRYAGRNASPSRIEKPLSKFTSVKP